MHYPAPRTPKSSTYHQSTVDVVSITPSYSSWGTLPTPPPTNVFPKNSGSSPFRSGPPSVHPLLQSPGHLLRYDIRHPPPRITEQAFNPAVNKAYITIKGLPEFSFNIENYNGITVHDTLKVLYNRLQRPMVHSDLCSLTSEDNEMAKMSFHTRTSMDPNEYVQGMKLLDRLSSRFYFVGLTPSPTPGIWEAHFA